MAPGIYLAAQIRNGKAAFPATDEEWLRIVESLSVRLDLARKAYLRGDLFHLERLLTQLWDQSDPPGGYVCLVCLTPIESEPCAEHGVAL